MHYESSATTVKDITDNTTYSGTEILESTEENFTLETNDIVNNETFVINDKINAVYATDQTDNIINTTDANILEAIVERVETILKAETSGLTDLLLQNTETSIISASESITDMKNRFYYL